MAAAATMWWRYVEEGTLQLHASSMAEQAADAAAHEQ